MAAYFPVLFLIVMIAFALAVVGLMGLAAWALIRVIRRNPPRPGSGTIDGSAAHGWQVGGVEKSAAPTIRML